MSQLLALEWDQREARVAIATSRGRRVTIQDAFSVDLRPATSDTDPPDVGKKIDAALAARRLARATTLVAVGRPGIELRRLSLPACPEDELPEMVRFQALREFTTVGEEWPIDFLPLASDDETRQVLAAAIAPELVDSITQTCQTAGQRPRRLALRPFAAASLLRRSSQSATARIKLLVDLLTEEADLTVMVDDQVVFPRTVRLPGEPGSSQQQTALVQEIRRTMAAAQNQLGGRRVEHVFICGKGDEHAALASKIEEEFQLSVSLFDPFAVVDSSRRLTQEPPQHAGRFAPLLGMILDETDRGAGHAIDFLNPRRSREAATSRRRLAIIGGVATVAILSLLVSIWWMLGAANAEIAALENQLKLQKPNVTAAVAELQRAEKIQAWLDQDANWLEELREVSQNAPPAEQLMLRKMVCARHRQGGVVSVDGVVSGASITKQMSGNLRNPRHVIVPVEEGVLRGEPLAGIYRWQFAWKVIVLNDREFRASENNATNPKK